MDAAYPSLTGAETCAGTALLFTLHTWRWDRVWLWLSKGLAATELTLRPLDPRDPAVYRKLREKHPTRKADVDFDLEQDFRLADELRPDVKFAKL